MEKRLIVAIALSVFIVLGFQYLAPRPPVTTIPGSSSSSTSVSLATQAIIPEESVMVPADEKTIDIETANFIITFSNVGGSVKKIKLNKFKKIQSDEDFDLFNLTNPATYVASITSVANSGLDKAIYTVEKRDKAIIYSATVNDIRIIKKYTIASSRYGINLDISIQNLSGAEKQFSYRIIGGSGLTEKSDQDKRLVEVTADINGKTVGYKRPKPGERIINPGLVTWTVLKNKYFSLILKPFIATRAQFYSEDKSGILTMGIETDEVVLQPNGSIDNKFMLYAGPSSIPMLKEAGCGIDATVNYGFFGAISKVMVVILGFFYNITHSWGFSVILLAIFLNLITFPLTAKSFKSMQKMQELHPQMELLKKQHKDSPEKLNKEIMELYKKYKINPLSGCLPILLQMPIFIALYQALMKCIELRNASFFWIKDLSSPDAVSLPFTLPIIGNSINILPLIMVGAMVMQQKMSTKTMGSAVTPEQKEQQKIMLIVMPVVFGFIFYSMPSGLVLYWVVNTFLTIGEQAAMAKNTA